MGDYPGGDTLGIVSKVATGDVDSLNVAITADSVVWVYGCVFETERISEEESDTITSNERGWAFLPYVAGLGIPAVDNDGNQVVATIDNSCWVRPKRPDALAQRDYKVYGLPALQYDIEGQPDHVWITCEWHGG